MGGSWSCSINTVALDQAGSSPAQDLFWTVANSKYLQQEQRGCDTFPEYSHPFCSSVTSWVRGFVLNNLWVDFSSMTLHICVLHLCKLFTSTVSCSTEAYILSDKHLFIPFGTEQLWISFDDLYAYIGKALSFASHLFHASQDFTITSLFRLLSPIWCCYVLYGNRSCFTDPSPNIPGLLPHFWVLHMTLKWDAPKGWGSGPRTRCLPLCLFSSVTILKSAFAFLTTVHSDLRRPLIDLINFICDKSGLIIYFYPLLTIFQPTHT